MRFEKCWFRSSVGLEQQLKSVELLLEQLTIKSPVSGIVGQKYYENGEYVKENEKILTLIDTSSVDAVIYIQEKDIVNFSIGTQVNIEIPSLNKNVKSTISEISLNYYQANLNYAWAKYMKNGTLPVNLLVGWSQTAVNNKVEAMFSFAYASEYAVLANCQRKITE